MDISFDLNSIIGALLAASIPIYVSYKQIKGQRALEKEMFFRQEKYNICKNYITELNEVKDILRGFYEDFEKLNSLHSMDGYEKAEFCANLIGEESKMRTLNIICIPYDDEESKLLDYLELEKSYSDFYKDFIEILNEMNKMYLESKEVKRNSKLEKKKDCRDKLLKSNINDVKYLILKFNRLSNYSLRKMTAKFDSKKYVNDTPEEMNKQIENMKEI